MAKVNKDLERLADVADVLEDMVEHPVTMVRRQFAMAAYCVLLCQDYQTFVSDLNDDLAEVTIEFSSDTVPKKLSANQKHLQKTADRLRNKLRKILKAKRALDIQGLLDETSLLLKEAATGLPGLGLIRKSAKEVRKVFSQEGSLGVTLSDLQVHLSGVADEFEWRTQALASLGIEITTRLQLLERFQSDDGLELPSDLVALEILYKETFFDVCGHFYETVDRVLSDHGGSPVFSELYDH
ncbi:MULTISPECIES: hypothetical protein [unclassified Shimia]|uniref:hypothetical protein n=1 Tax=unclassified Shimia TaxID=2630038 RepID=UPI00310325BB